MPILQDFWQRFNDDVQYFRSKSRQMESTFKTRDLMRGFSPILWAVNEDGLAHCGDWVSSGIDEQKEWGGAIGYRNKGGCRAIGCCLRAVQVGGLTKLETFSCGAVEVCLHEDSRKRIDARDSVSLDEE